MKGLFVLVAILLIVVGSAYYGVKAFRQKIDSALSAQPSSTTFTITPTPTSPAVKQIQQMLFVPYWSLKSGQELPLYQTLVYFGIQVGKSGIDKTDDGYTKLQLFADASGDEDKILTVRMIDSKTNFSILKDQSSQTAIIKDSIDIAKKYNFKGILLNIEVSALPFASLIDQITSFNAKFAKEAHQAELSYSITSYGDTFYRVRPFDVTKLSKDVDSVYIMAYDFHKAGGNPGPNFPLAGNETYGYDYDRMISNFADAVSLKKLIVVFGMYGYAWPVDEKGAAKEIASSLALKDIKASIIDNCAYTTCEWERDTKSAEIKATYKESDSNYIVWFEDEESVKRKQDFLKSRGVGSFAYWAYSYF